MSQVHSVTHVPVHSLPLAAFAVVVGFVFHEIRVGVAGRNRPAEMGGEGRIASEDREETSSRLLMWLRSL
jgi:hypothetical protein